MEWDGFVEQINMIFENINCIDIKVLKTKIDFCIKSSDFISKRTRKISYSKHDFDKISKELYSFKTKPTYIYNEHEIERVIVTLTRMWRIRSNLKNCNKVENSRYEYLIQQPTERLLLSVVMSLSKNDVESINKHLLYDGFLSLGTDKELDFYNLIQQVLRINYSIKVVIKKDSLSEDNFNKYIKSFLYTYAYNTSNVFDIIDIIPDMYKNNKYRLRISRLESVDIRPPERIYNDDLIERYNIALTSDEPYIQFISYYQIIEYFFDEGTKDKLLENTKKIISQPKFSLNDDKRVYGLIKQIEQDLAKYYDGLFRNELEALKYIIDKYISMNDLIIELNELDPKLIQYYKTTPVSFSNGSKLNFDSDNKEFVKSISERIYYTRNALVHNKSNNARPVDEDKAIYHPTDKVHKEELFKEIYLMRIIAEKIIFGSSKEI